MVFHFELRMPLQVMIGAAVEVIRQRTWQAGSRGHEGIGGDISQASPDLFHDVAIISEDPAMSTSPHAKRASQFDRDGLCESLIAGAYATSLVGASHAFARV